MADKVTCCPHCNTSFRITDSQLASAKGAVRCGSCLQVFKASDHLVANDAEPSEHQEPVRQEPEHQEPEYHAPEYHSPEPFSPSSSDEDSAPADDEPTDDDSDDLLISDDMDDDAEQDDFSAEFLVDTQAPQAQGGMFDRKITPKTEEHDNTDDDSWAEALLDEDDSERREPVFTITGETEEDQAEHEAAAEQHLIDADSAYTQTHTTENIEPGNVDRQPKNREILNSIADAPVEMEWHPEHSVWPRRLLWGSLNLALLATLALQIGWFNFDTLSRQEPYRNYYQALCPTLGCEVPSNYDINLIKSYNLVVRSHPDAQNALAIDSILLNTANYPQPFPKLTLVFSDINNNPVAHRTFEPGEYLAGELAGITEMPSQSPVHIALEILDPGSEAVNYQLAIVAQ